MGLLDANLQLSIAQAITTTAASARVLDLATMTTITTSFVPADQGNIGPNASFFGEDLGMGSGIGEPRIIGSIGAAFASGTSLNAQFQGAPSNATAQSTGLVSDLVFATYIETGAIVTALLTAGARLFSFAWPKRLVAAALPRFVRMNYVVVGTYTTGTLTVDVALGGDDAQDTLPQYPSGYTVGA